MAKAAMRMYEEEGKEEGQGRAARSSRPLRPRGGGARGKNARRREWSRRAVGSRRHCYRPNHDHRKTISHFSPHGGLKEKQFASEPLTDRPGMANASDALLAYSDLLYNPTPVRPSSHHVLLSA